MNAKSLLAKRKQERHFNAVERAAKAADALQGRMDQLLRTDSQLKRLLAESDAAERLVRETRG